MSTPALQNLGTNLYQIPECSICLVQLSKDLAVLNCGHCFHSLCIMQHFQYRDTCPYCQKKSFKRQVLVLHFQAVLKTRASFQNPALQFLRQSQQKQIEQMVKQLKIKSEQVKRLQKENNQVKLQLQINKHSVNNIRSLVYDQRQEIDRLCQEILGLKNSREYVINVLDQTQKQEKYLRDKIEHLENKLMDYEILQKYQKVMNSSQQLSKIKSQMQENNTPPKEMAKQFYSLCQIARLEQAKIMQKLQDLQQKILFHQQQSAKLKDYNQKLEKEIKKLKDEMYLSKKRGQQLTFMDSKETNDNSLQSNFSTDKVEGRKTKKTKVPRKKDDKVRFQP